MVHTIITGSFLFLAPYLIMTNKCINSMDIKHIKLPKIKLPVSNKTKMSTISYHKKKFRRHKEFIRK